MKKEIPLKEKADGLAAATIAIILFLTAWGNAIALMIASVLGLIVLLVVCEGKVFRGAALGAAVALSAGIILAIALFLGWTQ